MTASGLSSQCIHCKLSQCKWKDEQILKLRG